MEGQASGGKGIAHLQSAAGLLGRAWADEQGRPHTETPPQHNLEGTPAYNTVLVPSAPPQIARMALDFARRAEASANATIVAAHQALAVKAAALAAAPAKLKAAKAAVAKLMTRGSTGQDIPTLQAQVAALQAEADDAQAALREAERRVIEADGREAEAEAAWNQAEDELDALLGQATAADSIDAQLKQVRAAAGRRGPLVVAASNTAHLGHWVVGLGQAFGASGPGDPGVPYPYSSRKLCALKPLE